MKNEILHKQIEDQFRSFFTTPPDIPDDVLKHLSHPLRPYQKQALKQFIFSQELDSADEQFNHLLFHMATGSGKTLVLAAAMLYYFREQQRQNFIFFVNSDAIIRKTYDNLTNIHSPKYLFKKEGIFIHGNEIHIQIVDVFPTTPDPHTIYLKLTTIQKLHMDLTNPRENSLTYEMLEGIELVLLADEAHHINSWTRRDQRKLNTREALERTWENTVQRLLQLHHKNRLLEFTATIDLTREDLFEKYKDKIVYQYDLQKFMADGYSKNVMLLRANEDDQTKMLHGILLSQYRKYIAQDHQIDLKPVILFKSNKIATSLEAHEMLFTLLDDLTIEKFEQIITEGHALYQNKESIWGQMFSYYETMDAQRVIRDLQWDFSKGNTLNANDQDFLSEANALLLNTLEEPENPIRAIFAVAKLNEGWDVLNLFDIVRISEGGASHTRTTTDSEAQLIGRGARYYPFAYEGEQSFIRRFDYRDTPLKAIEALYYHTINENRYIQNLEASLEAANIQVKEDEVERIEAKIKPAFRKHPLFQTGKVYINKREKTTAEDFDRLEKYGVLPTYEIPFETAIEQQYGQNQEKQATLQTHELTWKVDDIYKQKAIQRNPFFHFHHLQNFIPILTSMKTFIESPNFLGPLQLHISLPINWDLDDLRPQEKLRMVEVFFEYMERNIRRNYAKERGTPVFKGVAISKLIDNYYVEFNQVRTNISDMDAVIQPRNMRDHHWFIYDKAIVNHLESSFIDFINDFIASLEEKYEDVFLIRNERKVKIVEIDGTRGFMPDFLLYLKDAEYTYQIFLEPKGDHLRLEDQWKEEFLQSLSLRDDIEILSENEDVRLLGMKFYSETPELKEAFRKDFTEKLFPDVEGPSV